LWLIDSLSGLSFHASGWCPGSHTIALAKNLLWRTNQGDVIMDGLDHNAPEVRLGFLENAINGDDENKAGL